MEEYALDRTQREVSSLLKSAPKRALVVGADGQEHEVAGEEPAAGQRVRVRPGGASPPDDSDVGHSAHDRDWALPRPGHAGHGEVGRVFATLP